MFAALSLLTIGCVLRVSSEILAYDGLVTDVDALRRKVRGLFHPKCKSRFALAHDDPIRLHIAIAYLQLHGTDIVPKSPLKTISDFHENHPSVGGVDLLQD